MNKFTPQNRNNAIFLITDLILLLIYLSTTLLILPISLLAWYIIRYLGELIKLSFKIVSVIQEEFSRLVQSFTSFFAARSQFPLPPY